MYIIELNPWIITAIVLAALVTQIVGALWYSPKVGFGKKWMMYVGMHKREDSKEEKKKMYIAYGLSTLSALFVSYGIAILSEMFFVSSLISAIILPIFLWTVCVAPLVAINYIYNPKLSFPLYCIDAGYHLVSIISISIVQYVLL